jgi:hypothetical protein
MIWILPHLVASRNLFWNSFHTVCLSSEAAHMARMKVGRSATIRIVHL